jgi:fucose permease
MYLISMMILKHNILQQRQKTSDDIFHTFLTKLGVFQTTHKQLRFAVAAVVVVVVIMRMASMWRARARTMTSRYNFHNSFKHVFCQSQRIDIGLTNDCCYVNDDVAIVAVMAMAMESVIPIRAKQYSNKFCKISFFFKIIQNRIRFFVSKQLKLTEGDRDTLRDTDLDTLFSLVYNSTAKSRVYERTFSLIQNKNSTHDYCCIIIVVSVDTSH